MPDQVKEWETLQQAWYRLYDQFAAAIAKAGGIGTKRPLDLNPMRAADHEAEAAILPILKRTSPTHQQLSGHPAVISAEHPLAVTIYVHGMKLRDLCTQASPDLTAALDQVAAALKQIALALKYVTGK